MNAQAFTRASASGSARPPDRMSAGFVPSSSEIVPRQYPRVRANSPICGSRHDFEPEIPNIRVVLQSVCVAVGAGRATVFAEGVLRHIRCADTPTASMHKLLMVASNRLLAGETQSGCGKFTLSYRGTDRR